MVTASRRTGNVSESCFLAGRLKILPPQIVVLKSTSEFKNLPKSRLNLYRPRGGTKNLCNSCTYHFTHTIFWCVAVFPVSVGTLCSQSCSGQRFDCSELG